VLFPAATRTIHEITRSRTDLSASCISRIVFILKGNLSILDTTYLTNVLTVSARPSVTTEIVPRCPVVITSAPLARQRSTTSLFG